MSKIFQIRQEEEKTETKENDMASLTEGLNGYILHEGVEDILTTGGMTLIDLICVKD